MAYWVKPPWWLKAYYSQLIWRMPDKDAVYLTFDDGPHPSITPYVLDCLKEANAQATFFCIGKNVVAHQDVYSRILKEGHATGNHTHNHYNGWRHTTEEYLLNIEKARTYIDSPLYRPPYGRIKKGQINALTQANLPYSIYMWDVLSGDFDKNISPKKCLNNVLNKIRPGSIVVFHDSEKAWERMSYALPQVLEYCNDKNWKMKGLPK